MSKSKRKKKIGIVIAVLIVLAMIIGIVSCSKKMSASIMEKPKGVTELSTAEKRDILDYISVSGSVESENMVKITSTLIAKVKKLNVEIGSEVKQGDILLEFDSSDLQQEYDTLKKNIDNATDLSSYNHSINERNLKNAKAEKTAALNAAQRSIDEAINARNNAVSREAELSAHLDSLLQTSGELKAQLGDVTDPEIYDDLLDKYYEAELNVQSAQAQLFALREQLPVYESAIQSAKDAYEAAERNADAAIQGIQDMIDTEKYGTDNSAQKELQKLASAIENCTVRAPKSGIITSLNVAEGSLPTSEALMTIENKDALKITVLISEADILKIYEGMPAVVTAAATGDKEYPAVVSRVVNIYKSGVTSYGLDTGAGGYSAEITINDNNSELLIGMNAKAKLILTEKRDVLTVPYESILENDDGSSYVFLAVTDEARGVTTAKAAKVEPGMTGPYYVEISSDEVKEGDRVVIDAASCQDGDELTVLPAQLSSGK